MFLEVGDRVLIKKHTKLSKILPFSKRKYDFVANVINTKGDVIECGPPVFTLENIYKYINNPNYDFVVLRPSPKFSVAQKAIWVRKIKLLQGKKFTRRNKNVDINTYTERESLGAGTATLLADNHCSKLKDVKINSVNDYLKLTKEGHFEILFDSYEE